MFTFLLVPFALLRQKGKGLSRQGKPFSSTVFHLRESLFSRIQNAENFEELVHYSKPKFCHSNFESKKNIAFYPYVLEFEFYPFEA